MARKIPKLFKIELWPLFLYFLIVVFALLSLLFFRLGSLIPPAAPEINTYREATNLRQIIENPLNAHHKTLQFITVKLNSGPSIFALRSASAAFGVFAATCFYFVLKHWQTRRMAALGTLLFVSSSWFLHIARLGTTQATQWLLLGMVAYGVWILKTVRYSPAVIGGALLLAGVLYTPGLVWFALFSIIWQRNRLKQLFLKSSWVGRLGGPLIFLILILPLGLALVKDRSLIISWLGVPNELPGVTIIGKNIIRVPLQLLVRGPDNPLLWLGTLPVMDLFTSSMSILGAYAYYFKLKLDRVRVIIGIVLVSTIIIGLGGSVDLTIILPFVYVMVAAGITLLIQQWFTVFPRNPWARSVGLSLVTAGVLLSVYYQLNSYFIAWPNTPATKEVFNTKNSFDLLQ